MFWCLVIPAVPVTLMTIVVLAAPSNVLLSFITSLLRGCMAIVMLMTALLLSSLALMTVVSLLSLQVDGTLGFPPRGIAGLGVVVRDRAGVMLAWSCERAAAATSNEAEYLAVITGLTLVIRRFPGAAVRCLTDSRIVVDQLTGRHAVRAMALKPLHERARMLVDQHGSVTFIAIPRELNRLADALAWEALDGRGWLARVRREAALTAFNDDR